MPDFDSVRESMGIYVLLKTPTRCLAVTHRHTLRPHVHT